MLGVMNTVVILGDPEPAEEFDGHALHLLRPVS